MVHHTAIYSRHFTTDHHDWLIIFYYNSFTLWNMNSESWSRDSLINILAVGRTTAKMDVKETGWRVLNWIYLIEVKVWSRAFVNMALKFEQLCDCQRVKNISAPLIMFVTRHTLLDLANQKASLLNFVGLFTSAKANCASMTVLFTVKLAFFWGSYTTCVGKLSVYMLQQVVNIVTNRI